MRVAVLAFALLALAGGCRTAEPTEEVEPVRSASLDNPVKPPAAVAEKPTKVAAPTKDPAPSSQPPPATAPTPGQRAPQGYALVYPGSSTTGIADETTQGNGERNRIVHRTTGDSMEQVAKFFVAKLALQETLSLPDRKILTGALPRGGRIAVTLTKEKGSTLIEVVAVEAI